MHRVDVVKMDPFKAVYDTETTTFLYMALSRAARDNELVPREVEPFIERIQKPDMIHGKMALLLGVDTFLGTVNGQFAGLAMGYRHQAPHLNKQFWLHQFYVLPEFRKLGVGFNMMLTLMADAHRNGMIEVALGTECDNVGMQSLAKRCGMSNYFLAMIGSTKP